MADSSSNPASPKVASSKVAGSKGRAGRSDSEALIALAAEEGAKASKARKPKEPAGAEDLIEENRQSVETFVRANAAVLEGMAALSAEMLAFGNKRLSANIERSQTLAGCHDMEQAFKVQTAFFESAVQQYLDQANQMMEIMTTINRSFWPSLETQNDEANQGPGGDSETG